MQTANEEWLALPGFGGAYEVSSFGRVRSLSRQVVDNGGVRTAKGRMLKQVLSVWGYYRVGLCEHGEVSLQAVHRLVALAFIPNPQQLPEVNHIDGVKTNNCVSNLEWVTSRQNTQHAYRSGLISTRKGESQPGSKLTSTQVQEIRKRYKSRDRHGCSGRALAREYGVSQSVISDIIRKVLWKHI